MKYLIKTLAVLALCAIFVACEKGKTDDSGLTENQKKMAAAVESYVPNVVYSTYKALADESDKLYDALEAASQKGVNALTQSDVDAICDIFLKARKYWEQSEAFLYGPATSFGIDPHIDTWPLDVVALATALSNADQVKQLAGEEGIAYAGGKLGQELLGFHGLEFILFRDGKNRNIAALKAKESDVAFEKYNVTGEQELIYATAIAGDLRDNCFRLYAAWNPEAEEKYIARLEEIEAVIDDNGKIFGDNMLGAAKLGSTFATWEEVISTILIGGCSNICAEVADVKMGNAHSGENTNYIESPYSENSFLDFIDNILSIQFSLYGAQDAKSAADASIMNLLKEMGYKDYATLQNSLDGALKALEDCKKEGAFVKIYANASVQTAMDAVSALNTELVKASNWIVKQ